MAENSNLKGCVTILKDIYTYKTKNGKTIKVREARVEDAERMLTAAVETLVDAPYMLTTVESVQKVKVEDLEKMVKYYENNSNFVQFIAEIDGRFVGAIDFKNGDKEKISHQGSFGMTVSPEYRGFGVGRVLLETLIEWAKNNDKIEKICLEVMHNNKAAIHLYEKFDFIKEGRKRRGVKLDDGYQDLIQMALFVK